MAHEQIVTYLDVTENIQYSPQYAFQVIKQLFKALEL